MNWKKSLAVSISIFGLVLSEQVIQACADYDHYDTYPSFFGNRVPEKAAFTPFNFIGGELYYFDNYWLDEYAMSGPNKVNKDLLLAEWHNFVGKDIALKDIETVLYADNDAVLKAISNGEKKSDEWASNAFVKYLGNKKNKSVLQYLQFAKSCEAKANKNNEEWLENKTPQKTESSATLQVEGFKMFEKEKQSFLKMKYAFQVLRLAFYDERNEEVLLLFDKMLKSQKDNSIAYTRSLGFKAGAYYRLGDKTRAGYHYALMFENNDAYKYDAMVSFEWARKQYDNETNVLRKDRIDDIYALCQNDKERAVVLVMKALRAYPGYALDDIKKAYALYPQVGGIDVLINREINKLEDSYFRKKVYEQNTLADASKWYYSIRSLDYTQSEQTIANQKRDEQYIAALNAFLQTLIQDKKAGTPALWYLSQAYLACMQNKPDEMQLALNNASQSGMRSKETALHKMIELLYTLYKSKTITPEIESELLPKLKSLNQIAIKDHTASYQFRDVMNHLVAGKYFQQGDTIKGVYAMGHANSWDSNRVTFYADKDFQDMQGDVLNKMTVASLKKVQDYRKSANKSPFENWLVEGTYYSDAVLRELEGTMYIRSNDFKSAIKIFEQNDVAQYSFANPFMPQINDYIELNAEDQKRTYTKLTFSKRMAELQDVIKSNPNDAGALYGYAVALYNISYYGKTSNIVIYNRSSTDGLGYFKDEIDSKLPRFLQEYYRVYTAEQYFNKAALAATDVELKAKALWGAAKCWTKRCKSDNDNKYYYYDKAYYLNGLKNPYFEKLEATFSNTKFMQTVKGNCVYYSDYLKQKG